MRAGWSDIRHPSRRECTWQLTAYDSSRRSAPPEVLDRQPPHDLDAELGVFGSIMLKPDVCDEIATVIRREDFYDETHGLLFFHMQDMHNTGKRVDITLLVDRLKKAGDFEKVGGAPFLARVSQAVPNAAHAAYYANIVREKAVYRSVIDASTTILSRAYEQSQDAKEFLNFAEQQMFAVMNRRTVTNVASDQRRAAQGHGTHRPAHARERWAPMRSKPGLPISTNSPAACITRSWSSWPPAPAWARRRFAMNIAENVAIHQGVPTLFVSLEMSSMELADRLLCSVGRINGHRLRNGTLPAGRAAAAGRRLPAK